MEDLAEAIQREFLAVRKDMASGFAGVRAEMATEFTAVRSEMATKTDLAELREEMTTRFATRSEVQSAVSSAKEELLEEIGKIKYAKEIDELRDRVRRVEQKLGMQHRAA